MSNTNTGGPAFPVLDYITPEKIAAYKTGMTLRDYFAISATDEDVAAHLQGPPKPKPQTDMMGKTMFVPAPTYRTREQARYAFADAMLKARES
jgi:nucleoid-associated protein YgaU